MIASGSIVTLILPPLCFLHYSSLYVPVSPSSFRCQLFDFHAPTGKDGTHPRLFEWVRDYFRKDTDFKSPLYLQHQGLYSRLSLGETSKYLCWNWWLSAEKTSNVCRWSFVDRLHPHHMLGSKVTWVTTASCCYTILGNVFLLNAGSSLLQRLEYLAGCRLL